MKTFIKLVLLSFIIFSCSQPISDKSDDGSQSVINNSVNIVWKGSLATPPLNPLVGWAFYNTTEKKSFIWDGDSWEMIAQDGVNGINGTDGASITWKGELSASPTSPQKNWAYYNIIDGNSYVWNGTKWDFLAKSGRDGATGILLWIGSLSSPPSTPATGWAYHDTIHNASYIWDGDSWEIIAQDGINGNSITWKGSFSVPPLNPELYWAYYNTTETKSYIWNGSSWDIIAQSLGGSTSLIIDITWKGSLTAAPSSPSVGWAYYNNSLGKSYIWDGTSWNVISQDGMTPSGLLISWKGSLSAAPSSPLVGWAYYSTTDKKSFIWDGDSWEILAQDGLSGSNDTNLSRIQILQNSKDINSYYNFGDVLLNTNSTEVQFEVKNIGSEVLYLTGTPKITINGVNSTEFSVNQSSLQNAINVGESSYFTVIFNPKATGWSRSAELSIECSDSTKNPAKLYLYGNGAGPIIDITPYVNGSLSSLQPELNLGNCGQYMLSKVSDIYVRNLNFKNTTLVLTGMPIVSISGANSDEFILDVTSLKSSIPYGDYTNKFSIQFAPKSTGVKTATITINNNSTESPVYSFNITGTGLVWDKRIDGGEGDGNDYVIDSLVDSSGNLYVLGYGYELVTNYSGYDWWIKKFDSSGVEDTVNWDKKIDFTFSNNEPISIVNDSSGNIYVSDASHIKKFSSSGVEDATNWNKAFGGNLRVDNSNNVYLFTNSRIRKFSTLGVEDTTNWNKTISGITINDVKLDASNNVYIAGYGSNLVDSYSDYDWWIKKYTENGVEDVIYWNKTIDSGHSDEDKAKSISIDSSNNIYILGNGYDLFSGSSRYNGWIKKFSSTGVEDLTWNKKLINDYSKIINDSNGNIYLLGSLVTKFSSSGAEDLTNWNKYNSSFNETSIAIDSSNYIFISGYGDDLISSTSSYDWWIKKYNSLGVEQ